MDERLLTLILAVVILLSSVKGCDRNGPLGMITGEIKDWQISASSSYPTAWDKNCHEKYARIYQPNSKAWCAKSKSSSEWLQIDMGVSAKITGVMIQGRADGIEWVTAFMVSYSNDAFHWTYATDQYGNQRVFEGNSDAYNVKHAYLDKPITVRFIKFHTVHWHKHPSMRVEVIGCQECKTFIGTPPYSKVSASTSWHFKKKSSCQPDDGHIFSSKAWCAKRNNAKQWLQFDVGPPTLVTGVVVMGRGDTRRKHWVTKFKLSYSNNTKTWTFYKDASHLDAKQTEWVWVSHDNGSAPRVPGKPVNDIVIFDGNVDKKLERYHFLNSPFIARYVRFHPVAWHNHIAMRAGILGCPQALAGDCGTGFLRVNDETPCIENLAFKRSTWINTKRHYKRHIRNRWTHVSQAVSTVDGKLDNSLETCTVLDNFYIKDNPTFMIDMGKQKEIAGVIVVTWQGSKAYADTSYKDYMYNLYRLMVYVDNKPRDDDIKKNAQFCGYISKQNKALYNQKLHVNCKNPIKGRYVYIVAEGDPNRWSRLFSAILCEVMIYG